MASQQVLNALEQLHQELNKLEPAIKHIETAQLVTQTVKDIPSKHLELLNDLKKLFADELVAITKENKLISKNTSEIQTEVTKELKEIALLKEKIGSFHDKVVQINFPERLDKLDANIAGIMAAIQSTQSRLDNVERNLSDKMRDLSDKQKEEFSSIKSFMEATTKKQQTFTYITWALIAIGVIAVIVLCKNN